MSALPLSSSGEPPAPKRERRKEARPAELLDAALDLFVEKGYAATRVEEVALRAGVSKGTLFLYFPSKEELFKAVVRQNISGNFAHWREALADFKGSIAACLHLSIQGWWVHVGATKASGIMKLMVAEGAKFPDLARFYRDEVVDPGNAMMLALLQAGVERGEFRKDLPLEDVMHSFASAMIHLVVWKHVNLRGPQPSLVQDPEGFLSRHVDLVLAGLGLGPAAIAAARAQAEAYIALMHDQADCAAAPCLTPAPPMAH